MEKNNTVNKKKSRRIKIISAFFALVIVALLAWLLLSEENIDIIRSVFTDDLSNDEIRDKLIEIGWRGYITVGVLAMLQVVLTFLPAEPVQVVAGLTFGFFRGFLCCLAGVILGNTVIFVLYKIYGDRMRHFFDKNLDFDLSKAAASGKLAAVIFLLYFLPAIPYGMICFFAATVGTKYPRYMFVTVLGSIPSIVIGVGLGHAAIAWSWIVSVVILAFIVLALIFIMIKREFFVKKINDFIHKTKEPYSSRTVVREYSRRILSVLYVGSRVAFFGKVKLKYTNNIGRLPRPSLVLCNHGSFIDFAYAGTLIRKESPNFPVARLYFYKRGLGNLLRRLGCFPKSMFAMDVESVTNCTRVIKRGGVLAMMPEARLSTAGKFEDIQEGTFAFIKKMGVPVYNVKIRGAYLAKPKWGKGLRRGARVEAEIVPLFSAEEISALTVEEIRERTLREMYFDEFEWLSRHPEIRYKHKRLAEGLENILVRCPACGAAHSIATKGHSVRCERCGLQTELTDRYGFCGGVPFENFAKWYEWQTELIKGEVLADQNYKLTSKVTLKKPSKDGKTMLRVAGEGICTLDRDGLKYVGTLDGEPYEKMFPMSSIYRLLFGAGENFEIYEGKDMYFFVPEEPRSSVDWYIVSKIIRDEVALATQAT